MHIFMAKIVQCLFDMPISQFFYTQSDVVCLKEDFVRLRSLFESRACDARFQAGNQRGTPTKSSGERGHAEHLRKTRGISVDSAHCAAIVAFSYSFSLRGGLLFAKRSLTAADN